MEKFIPYEKLSKKEKRKIDQARRQTWGELNPVTRKPENSKVYNRKRTQDWKENFQTCVRLFCHSVKANSFSSPWSFLCRLGFGRLVGRII